MNLRKDVVRRAANIQENSCSSCVDSLLEALRPPLLHDMQDTGHCILSPLKKESLPDIDAIITDRNRHICNAFTLLLSDNPGIKKMIIYGLT